MTTLSAFRSSERQLGRVAAAAATASVSLAFKRTRRAIFFGALSSLVSSVARAALRCAQRFEHLKDFVLHRCSFSASRLSCRGLGCVLMARALQCGDLGDHRIRRCSHAHRIEKLSACAGFCAQRSTLVSFASLVATSAFFRHGLSALNPKYPNTESAEEIELVRCPAAELSFACSSFSLSKR
jgi:hypothetical protein